MHAYRDLSIKAAQPKTTKNNVTKFTYALSFINRPFKNVMFDY